MSDISGYSEFFLQNPIPKQEQITTFGRAIKIDFCLVSSVVCNEFSIFLPEILGLDVLFFIVRDINNSVRVSNLHHGDPFT